MASHSIGALPAGFKAVHTFDFARSRCREWYVVQAPDGHVSAELCTDSLTFQADLDEFVNTALNRSGGNG